MTHYGRNTSATGWTWAACLLAALLAGCGVGVTPESRIKRADELLAKGDYGAAMLEIRNALQEQPKNGAAHLTAARASLMLNNAEAAAKSLDEALANGADKAAAAQLRVQLLQQTGANADLLKLLDDNTLPLSPLQRELARAQALVGLKRCAEAIRVARPLVADADMLVPARVVLAECYAQAGHPSLALEMLEIAVQKKPTSAAAWMALGRVQQLSGNVSEAEAAWKTAIEHAPGQLSALQLLTMLTALGAQQLGRGDFA